MDPVLGSWQKAFSLNLQAHWRMAADASQNGDRPWIIGYHKQRGQFMWSINWEQELGRLNSRVRVERHHLHTYTMDRQVAVFQAAGGLFGNSGAQFVWLLWMKAGSAAFLVWFPVVYGPNHYTCERIPDTYQEVNALTLGHTFLTWKFCGPEHKFLEHEPVKVLQYLSVLHKEDGDRQRRGQQSRGCFILRDPALYVSWPECDVMVTAPQTSTQTQLWHPYLHVGHNPLEDPDSRVFLDLNVSFNGTSATKPVE